MNTHITAHKAKVRHLCFFLILGFRLVYAGVPGPCKHSVTQDHLLNLRRLMKNQMQNGCSITYTFTERQNLGVVCYVKAAFPHILELLNTQFRYARDSDNYRYTNSLKNLIYNIYSQRCIPPINEEIEDSPMKFIRTHMTLPRAALEKAEEVIRMYMGLMIQNDKPVDWNCEEEYTEDYPESTTEPLRQTAGASNCACICPTASNESSKSSASTSHWNIYPKSTLSSQRSSFSPVETSGNEGTLQFKSAVPVTNRQTLDPGTPATWRSEENLSNFLFGSTPVLHKEPSNSERHHVPSPDLFPSFTNFQDVFPSRTDSSVETTTSGPNRKSTSDSTQDHVENSTPLLLAKRSLDFKSQTGPSSSYVKLSQNSVAPTSEPAYREIKSKPSQMLQQSKHIVPVTATVLSSLKTAAYSSEGLSALVEEPGHLHSPPENFQTHTQSPVRVPRNFMRTIHEAKLSKDRGSQEMKDQIHPDRENQRNTATEQSSSAIISFGTVLLVALGCGGLLLITVLFYRQQKVSDSQLIFALLRRPH
ncbi:macrophage colony-stimulating factor 1a [Puntigrus tetrazona]|uniref:macrophage colony-stimulating factor 1a n=1 Tax=Puntigrus tetrazona TaxID=1606681 RepID=UPI001C890F15|nr:macrophage colony-stimulating factor 1a [Puntigrus tetrazona]